MSLDIAETKRQLAEIEANSGDELPFLDKDLRSLLEIRQEMLGRGF